MDKIKQHYPQYFENTCDLCFKMCFNKDIEYIVVMHKLPDTKTNESRLGIENPLYASFRGNKFMVLKIFSKIDPSKTLGEIKNSFFLKKITYKVGEKVSVDDFDDNLEEVCSTGIHYLKSVEAAFYCGHVPINYSGTWCWYYHNGNKQREYEYLNGRLNGKHFKYYYNGNIIEEGEYLNDEKNDKWIFYCYNGTYKEVEGGYLNGKKNGMWTYYYANGNKKKEEEYLNGEQNGNWDEYYENRKKEQNENI